MDFLTKNSWTLNLAKLPAYTEFGGDWKYPVDKRLCKMLLECDEKDEFGDFKITPMMKQYFKSNIVDNLVDGHLHVTWNARHNLGRRYSAQDCSGITTGHTRDTAGNLGVHSKYIKNTIFAYQGWVDYDMVKGHPSLLLNMARHAKVPGGFPAIERFVNEFDNGYCQELCVHYSMDGEPPVTKDDIKDLHNRTIYGGGHENWVKDMMDGEPLKGKPGKDVCQVIHPSYAEFRKEIKRIIDYVYFHNPDLVAQVCKPDEPEWQKKNRTMAYFCGILENECLKHAYKFGLRENLFPQRGIDLCYDGFTAPAPPVGTDMDAVIASMNAYILEKTGFHIRFKVKPFEKVITSVLEARRADVDDDATDEADDPDDDVASLTSDFDESQIPMELLEAVHACFHDGSDWDLALALEALVGNTFVSVGRKMVGFDPKTLLWSEDYGVSIGSYLSVELFAIFSKYKDAAKATWDAARRRLEQAKDSMNKSSKKYVDLKEEVQEKKLSYDVLAQILNKLKSAGNKNNIISQWVTRHTCVTFLDDANKVLNHLALRDGTMFNIRDKSVRPRVAEDKFTFCSNVLYKTLTQEEFDFADTYFSGLFPFPDQAQTKQCFLDVIKSCLLGRPLRFFYLCIGKGSNGKSAVFRLISDMLGPSVVRTMSKSILVGPSMGQNTLSAEYAVLDQCRIGIASELSKSDKLNIENLKTLSGEDKLRINEKYREPREITPTTNSFTLLNPENIPKIEMSNAVANRLVIFPFRATFDPDMTFLDRMMERRDVLFSYMMDQGNILDVGNFHLSPEMVVARNEFIVDNTATDNLAVFLESNYDKTDNPADRVKRDDIRTLYVSWLQMNKLIDMDTGFAAFTKRCSRLGFENVRSNSKVYIIGLKVKSTYDEDPDNL